MNANAIEKSGIHHIKEIKRKVPNNDSIPCLRLFYDFKWNVEIISKSGSTQSYINCNPDTISLGNDDLIKLTTDFIIASELLNQVYCFYYDISGSCLLKINNKSYLETGYFNKGTSSNKVDRRAKGFKEFSFNDTVIHLEIFYLPKIVDNNFIGELLLCQLSYRDQELKIENNNKLISFFTGSFHLAFAIIFIIVFVFFKTGRENLFFALYALFIGIYFMFSNFNLPAFIEVFLSYSWIIALEALVVFLSMLVLNKAKSTWLLISFLGLTMGLTFFTFITSAIISDRYEVVLNIFLGLMIAFEANSLLYYLMQGFSQKRWEAKTITIGFFAAILITSVSFIFYAISDKMHLGDFLNFIEYIPYLSLIIILITMSIILGRKNGENQHKLILQLKEIDILARENLAKEVEKKLLLENQNTELESKVLERTREIIRQKEIIEIKNAEITDNLNYAKRIQSAILPDITSIKKVFPQFFVLYLPKDIVSGDFYTFIPKGNEILIGCADCTGHGVSGAFMSMIGSSLFNQLVNERNIMMPDQILEELNK